MPKQLPPLTWFRAFDAAARHLSFTLAAEELGFTQSAISQHVRALEDRLGTQLFLRGHRALQLTDAGRMLVPDVAAAMARLTQATDRFLPTITRQKLTVATSASIASWVLAPRIAAFLALHPEIAVQIVTTVWPDDFSTTNADVEIRFGSPEVVGQNAELLQPSYLHAVAAPTLAAQCHSFDEGMLTDHVLIQPIGLSTGWNEIGRAQNRVLEASLFVDTHGLAVDLAIAGAGIALAHARITHGPLTDGRLVALPMDPLPAVEGYYLARKPTAFPEGQSAFINWFTAQDSYAHSAY